MVEKKYTLTCPICNKTYGMMLDDELLNTFLLIGKYKGGGLECGGCGSTIVFNTINLNP